MEIKNQYTYNDKIYNAHWVEDEPTHNLQSDDRIGGVHSICFYENKMLVVFEGKKKRWGPPGGGIEKGETYEQAVIREIKEESNMKVLYQKCIGYADVTDASGKKLRGRLEFFVLWNHMVILYQTRTTILLRLNLSIQ